MRGLRQLLLAAVAVLLLATPTGSALASHVECGAVITADTTLDSDLIDCTGDALRIGADDVTLDLGGHTVDGPAMWFGITNAGHRGVTVQNGVVQGFWLGIDFTGVADPHFRHLTMRSNGG